MKTYDLHVYKSSSEAPPDLFLNQGSFSLLILRCYGVVVLSFMAMVLSTLINTQSKLRPKIDLYCTIWLVGGGGGGDDKTGENFTWNVKQKSAGMLYEVYNTSFACCYQRFCIHVALQLFSNLSHVMSKCGKRKKKSKQWLGTSLMFLQYHIWHLLSSITQQVLGNVQSTCFT